MIDKTAIKNKIKTINEIEDNSQDDVIDVFIDVAIGKLLRLRYPFHFDKTEDDLVGFDSWIVRAVRSIYDTQGQYNITQFSQNGVQITYSNLEEGISSSLVREVMPLMGTVRK